MGLGSARYKARKRKTVAEQYGITYVGFGTMDACAEVKASRVSGPTSYHLDKVCDEVEKRLKCDSLEIDHYPDRNLIRFTPR